MILYPAIDIQGGEVVRLRRGDFTQSTIFSEDPVDMALQWEELGADAIHVVDLDGARTGDLVNFALVEAIVEAVSVPVQYGGGVRSTEAVARVAGSGLGWCVIGTAAVTRADVLEEAVKALGERLVVGVDCLGGVVATHGWRERSEMRAAKFARELEDAGVRRLLHTDIDTDGMMRGPNVRALVDLAEATSLEIIQSGGITVLDDLRDLAALGLPNLVGTIVGRALYEGAFTLPEALVALAT
jgi:phosphoribosylformimino-5-aminoimidazole carboxamide ribotide isomerase